MNTPGKKFRQAIADNSPLMVVGAVNAYCAKMAEKAGHKALYLSGAGVANASFGLPDLAITTLNDVAEDSRRITQATTLPLLIDIDGNTYVIRYNKVEDTHYLASEKDGKKTGNTATHNGDKWVEVIK